MEKYTQLLNNAAERVAREAAQGIAIIVDLERVKCILNAAESKIETSGKAG